MRRAPFVLTATAAGLAGVFMFHTHQLTSALPAASKSAGSGGTAPQGDGTAGSTTPPTTAPTTTQPNGSQSSTAPSTTVPPTTAVPTVQTARGRSIQYGYGIISVSVAAKGGHIQEVSVKRLEVADQYSQQLASQVIPTLRSEVLANQSARINGISGATYTSEAYAASVQSALDKLRIK